MSSGFLSAGTSFATGFPCFVISTVSLFACTSSMTARQCILKEPAAIFFILELRDHSHYTMVIFANQSELVRHCALDCLPLRRPDWTWSLKNLVIRSKTFPGAST